jgi:transcription antitermination factor NusG
VELVRDKQTRKHVITELPAMPNYIFAAMTEAEWHVMNHGMKIGGKLMRPHTVCNISPREWQRVRDFSARVEMDYQARMADLERQAREAETKGKPYLPPYSLDQAIKLLGGELSGIMAKYKGVAYEDGLPVIKAEINIMGRAVQVKASPDKVDRWMAE